MNAQTLANVFAGPRLEGLSTQLFSLADMEKTANLAAAQSVDGARNLVGSLVATAKDRLLDVPLMDIMLGAWTKIAAIQEYAIGDKLISDETHKFMLSEHKVTSKHSPKIELYVQDSKVSEVVIEIALTLIVATTNLMIRKGRILEVRLSGCKASGKLSCHGQTLLEQESTELEFPARIKLGDGIVIPPPLEISVA
jgi:hypothetical protein